MNLKNSKGSVLLMVTVFAMVFLVLALATMKILLQTNQDQSMESEIARIRLFYAADGISEIAMYAASKNLMYDPRGQNPFGTAGVIGTQRVRTSYQMEGDIWPNIWSTASGVHFDFSNAALTAVAAGVIVDKQTTTDSAAGVTHRYIRASSAAVIASGIGDPALMPPNLTGRQVLGGGGPYAYDVDFNVPYKSNSNPMASLNDGIKYRQVGGKNRQIWYMHLSTQNPNFVESVDYVANSFWCVYYPEMSPDNNIMVKATMYQEFVIPPDFIGGPGSTVRELSAPDFIGRGDGWPSVNVVARSSWPASVRQFRDDNGGFDVIPMGTDLFYQDASSAANHFNGGNARRRFFVIVAEARFNDQSAGGIFGETYRIETRFFIEDERSYGASRQYETYINDLASTGISAQVNKPRVKFYFRSRIPRPI